MESPSQKFREQEPLILTAALDAVDPEKLAERSLNLKTNILSAGNNFLDLSKYEKIHILGAGKGAPFFFKGVKKILGTRITGGLIISLKENAFLDDVVRFFPGDHPIPGENSFKAGKLLKEYVKKIKKNDLVIALITGGASSMVLSPPPGAGPEDATGLNKILIDSGAEISEINCVRKHFSTLKGGQLAALIYPAEIFILALSDTISSSPADIGSGMFSPDPTSYRDAMDILERYRLIKKAGEKAIKHLEAGIRGDIPETPTPGAKIFKNNRFLIAGDNLTALNAGANMGAKLGFETRLLEQSDSGDTKKAAKKYAVMIKNIIKNRKPGQHPILILAGGELTVKVKGEGKGGRNQEFILTILKELKDIKHPFFISSIGTDGIDGPTDAAGAWINERTIKKIGKDPEIIITKYLKNNDSYNFFDKTGNLIRTGPTKTNVMDIRMFLIS